jgi:hypothetical protein
MTFVSTSEDCEKVRGTVSCAMGGMADGASIARKITVRIEYSRGAVRHGYAQE